MKNVSQDALVIIVTKDDMENIPELYDRLPPTIQEKLSQDQVNEYLNGHKPDGVTNRPMDVLDVDGKNDLIIIKLNEQHKKKYLEHATRFSGVPGESLKNIPSSSQAWFTAEVLHEIFHSGHPLLYDGHGMYTIYLETEADRGFVKALEKDAPEVSKCFLAMRAIANFNVKNLDIVHPTNAGVVSYKGDQVIRFCCEIF